MDAQSSKNNRIAKNTAFLYFRMAIVMFASLYLARVILNVLGVEDYGIYNVVCGFVFILNVLNLTLSHGVHRYYNEEIGKNNFDGITKVFNSALRIQLIIILIVFILIETFGIWYIETKMIIAPERLDAARWIFQFSAISLVLIILQAPFTSAILSYERMDYYAYVSIIDVALKLGVAYLVQIINSDKLILYGFLMLCVSFVNFFLCFGYCKIQFKEIKFTKDVDYTLFKRMLTFSGWLILDPIAWAMRSHGSNLVLNLFFGTFVNAAYSISYQIGSALDQFCNGISTAFKPQLMQSYSAGDYERTNQLLYSMTKTLFVIKLMICVPIMLEIESILHLWLGDTFPTYALSFSSLTVIVRLIDSLNHPITTVIYATDQIKWYTIITSILLFSTLPASYILFKFGYNPNYLFIAMILLTGLSQLVSIEILSKQCSFFKKYHYLKNVIAPCMLHGIIVLILSYIVSSFSEQHFLRLFLVCITSIVISFISGFLIVCDLKEKKQTQDLLSRIINKIHE